MLDYEDIKEFSDEDLSLDLPPAYRPEKQPQIINLAHTGLWLGPAYLVLSGLAAWIAWRTGYQRIVLWWLPIALLAVMALISWSHIRRSPSGTIHLLCWRSVFVLAGISASLAWGTLFVFFLEAPLDWWMIAGMSVVTLGILVTLAAALHWLPVFLATWLTFVLGIGRFPLEMSQIDSESWVFWGIAIAILVFGLFSVLLASRLARQQAINLAMQHQIAGLHSQVRLMKSQMESQTKNQIEIEAQLRAAREQVDDAARSKTEFLATMSHEIRTPLNSILPILEILRDTELEDDQHEMTLTAYNSSQQLHRIIDDILDFARVESGKLELERIEVDLFELVDSITGLMWETAERKGLRLVAKIEENVPDQLHGDPFRLRQVLTNLISNSIKFTETGDIEIDISVRRGSKKEVELMFAVKDTGIGMSKATISKLFQPFTQADASTTRKYGGTGLGLVICKRLVDLMGGQIGVRSVLGEGSTFWFTLPMRRSVRSQPSDRNSLEGLRVLSLIQDDGRADNISRWLQEWGMTEDRAESPSDALSRIVALRQLGKSWVQHLLLADALLNEQQVMHLLKTIRNDQRLSRLHTLFLVDSEGKARDLEVQYGVQALVTPIKKERLKNVLNRLFDVEVSIHQSHGADDNATRLTTDASSATSRHILKKVDQSKKILRLHGNVLLVEDNPVNLAVAKRLLLRHGLNCITAIDGTEALECLKEEKVDMVLMDCQMPVMDGYEATRQIRQGEASSENHLPVIAMTANAMQGDKERCLAAGMDDYLPKPVSMDAMRIMLERWLVKSKQEESQPEGYQSASQPDQMPVEKGVPRAGSHDVLDQDVLDELKEVMEDDFEGVIRTYLNNTPELVDKLEHATSANDMLLPAHSLKSSSANVGALKLSDIAKEVELLAKTGDLVATSQAVGQLLKEYQQATDALHLLVEPS